MKKNCNHLKLKSFFDDEEEDNYVIHIWTSQVVPESDLGNRRFDTPLKPRLKSLDDTVDQKKVIEQMRPTNTTWTE